MRLIGNVFRLALVCLTVAGLGCEESKSVTTDIAPRQALPDGIPEDAIPGYLWFNAVDGTPTGELITVGEGGTILRQDTDGWHVDASSEDPWDESSLAGVAAVAADDIWAVGDYMTIRHHNGVEWETIYDGRGMSGWYEDSDSDAGGDGDADSDMDADGDADGDSEPEPDSDMGMDTEEIIDAPAVPLDPAVSALQQLSAWTSLNDIWAVSADNVMAAGSEAAIIEYDGEFWSVASGNNWDGAWLNGIWGDSSGAAFAVGDGATIYQKGADGWTLMSSCWGQYTDADSDTDGDSDGDIDTETESQDYDTKDMPGLDTDESWQYEQVVLPELADLGCTRINDVWGSSASDVYAVGSEGTILHYDGSVWTVVASGWDYDYGDSDEYSDADSDSDADGEIGMDTAEMDFDTEEFFEIEGPTGTIYPHITSASLNGVWGTDASNVWVVGTNGTVLHFNGEWETIELPVANNLKGVFGFSDSDITIVGSDNCIIHFDGIEWNTDSCAEYEWPMDTDSDWYSDADSDTDSDADDDWDTEEVDTVDVIDTEDESVSDADSDADGDWDTATAADSDAGDYSDADSDSDSDSDSDADSENDGDADTGGDADTDESDDGGNGNNGGGNGNNGGGNGGGGQSDFGGGWFGCFNNSPGGQHGPKGKNGGSIFSLF